ncbi:hypothetical protein [Psychrobacter sp. BF1]|uniref:hypothetical protein n=1 Tax=Psychrobacter sp. BF1 TaxID=2821147 RepID=UPI001C4DE066|nr:hypothetical protein [Psychrobacter sp. BF1]
MDIKELQARRDKLERDLYAANSKLISKFQDETGVDVSSVNIWLSRLETIGAPDRHIITNASVDIEV